jgi:hypothetical protein
MRVELFGLTMEGTGVTFYLWSPWRCSALEHRLFDAVKSVPGADFEPAADELRAHIDEPKAWKAACTGLSRVLKGWQEESSDSGTERRGWRWLVESDVDASGFDMHGERSCFWMYVRLTLDRGGPTEPEKGEDVDLSGFGVCVWTEEAE